MSGNHRDTSAAPLGVMPSTDFVSETSSLPGVDVDNKRSAYDAKPQLPVIQEADGHSELTAAAILKGDVIRHLTVFEKKAALINKCVPASGEVQAGSGLS